MTKRTTIGATTGVVAVALAAGGWLYGPQIWSRVVAAREGLRPSAADREQHEAEQGCALSCAHKLTSHGQDDHEKGDEPQGHDHDGCKHEGQAKAKHERAGRDGDSEGKKPCAHDHGEHSESKKPCAHGHGEDTEAKKPCAHGHGGHDHAAHAHGADMDRSPAEILAARCEHKMPAYQCSHCRYEVGVVKLDRSLMKTETGGGGIFGTIEVAKATVTQALDVTGEVQLNENAAAHLSPRIPGIIRSTKVDIGAQMKSGDALFEIESVELGEAMGECEKLRAMVRLSKKNFEREKDLFERKVASERSMIEAQMTYERYQAELQAGEQKLHVLGLTTKEIKGLERCEHDYLVGRLTIKAPLAGTVIEKHAVVGELVTPGRDVMLVADMSTVWVWANIYSRDLAPLIQKRRSGPIPVEVSVDAFQGRKFRGTLDYIGATMDEKTRTVKVRVTVQNDEQLLRPGMFCQIRILLAKEETVLAVPKAALLADEGVDFVFKHLKDTYYVRRRVKKGRPFDGLVEILAGLETSDTIVADGAFLMKSDVLREKMGEGCAH